MINSTYSKYLIIGATGGSGKELVNALLAKDKSVRVLVRNNTKAKTIFKDNYEKIDKVIELELGKSQVRGDVEMTYNPELLEAVEWCDVLICASGATMGGDSQQTDYIATVELLNHCQKSDSKFGEKLFVYISSLYITRPYSLVAFILNYMLPYVMGWKALAENRIRQSGLNYLIVRPGRLTHEVEPKTVEIHQGDRIKGSRISRKNLANMIIQSLTDPEVNKGKTTVDVIEKSTKEGVYEIKVPIKPDDEHSIITADHFKATRNLTISLYAVLSLLAILAIWKFK